MTSPFNRGDRVVAYCRYSEGDEQGLRNVSTEEQADAIRRFCEAEGLTLVQIFADPFASGRSVAGRDRYLEMLSYLLHKKRPDIQGVVLWDFERYGRNYDQAQLDAARLRMAGYKLYSLQQPIADNGPFSHVLEAMYFASAQNQSDMISADVRRALQNNFKKYKVVPRSSIPAGWIAVPVDMGCLTDGSQRVGYRMEPDPKTAPKIREAIAARLDGATLQDMKPILGDPFNHRGCYITKLMTKELLYGAFTYGGTTIEDYCTPIIDRETWNKLQTYNASQPKKIKKPGSGAYSKDRALLSGLLWCDCGERAYINRRRSKGKLYQSYYCNHRHHCVRAETLEPFIIQCALSILDGDTFEKAKRELLNAEPADVPVIDVAKLDKQIEAITEAIAEAGPSRGLLLKLKALESQREAVTAPKTVPDLRAREASLDRVVNAIREVLLNEKSDTETIRVALSLFIRSIVLMPDNKIVIKYTLPLVESESSGECSAPPGALIIRSQFKICVSPSLTAIHTAFEIGLHSQ